MIENTIVEGPVHPYDEFYSIPIDVEEPDLEIDQIATFEYAFREIVSMFGEWRWRAEFRILTNPNKKEMVACL